MAKGKTITLKKGGLIIRVPEALYNKNKDAYTKDRFIAYEEEPEAKAPDQPQKKNKRNEDSPEVVTPAETPVSSDDDSQG